MRKGEESMMCRNDKSGVGPRRKHNMYIRICIEKPAYWGYTSQSRTKVTHCRANLAYSMSQDWQESVPIEVLVGDVLHRPIFC